LCPDDWIDERFDVLFKVLSFDLLDEFDNLIIIDRGASLETLLLLVRNEDGLSAIELNQWFTIKSILDLNLALFFFIIPTDVIVDVVILI
jgi:hypothetical protein